MLASIVELRMISRFLIASGAEPYLNRMTSPCSVNRMLLRTDPAGWDKMAARVGAPPRPTVPPRPCSMVSLMPYFSDSDELFLCFKLRPGGGHLATILCGIGIPDHDLLMTVDVVRVPRDSQQSLQCPCRAFKVLERLKQRNDGKNFFEAAFVQQ